MTLKKTGQGYRYDRGAPALSYLICLKKWGIEPALALFLLILDIEHHIDSLLVSSACFKFSSEE